MNDSKLKSVLIEEIRVPIQWFLIMLISVITPVFNGRRYVAGAIESVLEQNYEHVEHVIVDGASTDGTVKILETFQRRYPGRIRFISEPDRGPCHALNKGWKMARGGVFGWLGSDDLYTPGALATVAEYFSQHLGAFFIYGECDLIDEYDQWLGRFATRDFSIHEAINKGVYIPFPAAFYRRELVHKIGGVRHGDQACDTDFIIRAGQKFKLQRIDETLSRFRLHAGGKTGSSGSALYPRALYLINRRYHGSLLSTVCLRYYRQLISRVLLLHLGRQFLARLQRDAGFNRLHRVAIFGASYTGAKCFQHLSQRGIEAICFLDNHPVGAKYCGRPILTPDAGLDGLTTQIDGIIIASSSSQGEMRRQLRKLGFKKTIACFSPACVSSCNGRANSFFKKKR